MEMTKRVMMIFPVLMLVFTSVWEVLGDPDDNKGPLKLSSRGAPLCVTDSVVTKYKAAFKNDESYKNFLKFVQQVHQLSAKNVKQSKQVGGDIEEILQVSYTRVKTGLRGHRFENTQHMANWIHITVQTKRPVDTLVVQAIGWPQLMPVGFFDLEFSGPDCGPDYPYKKVTTGNTLDLNGYALVLPCRRRSYLHYYHPYVYVYSGPKRTDFHMNYAVEDQRCFETKMLQLLLITGNDGSPKYAKTAVIHHGGYDFIYAEPIPYHPEIPIEQAHEPLALGVVVNGDEVALPVTQEFDSCILAEYDKKEAVFKDVPEKFISDWICKNPERHKCDILRTSASGNSGGKVEDPGKIDVDPLCKKCSQTDNTYTKENYKRLIGRAQSARRIHGYAMIFGCIHLASVSNFVARYMKEVKGFSCLLVGSWLWIHLICTFVGMAVTLLGFGLVVNYPPRRGTKELDPFDTREAVILIHQFTGGVSAGMYTVSCLSGMIRSKYNINCPVLIHAISGHGSVVFGVISVIISTSCLDAKILTGAYLLISLIFYAAAFFLQIWIDGGYPLIPPRKYFPVIEAVVMRDRPPMITIRLALVIGFVVITTIVLFLTIGKGGYKGLITKKPCKNCIYKYDESIRLETNMTLREKANVVVFYDNFNCKLADVDYTKYIN